MIATSLIHEITDFLAQGPSSQQIAAYNPSPSVYARAYELRQRERDNTITLSERAELDTHLRTEQFLALLKTKAQQKLMCQI